jgi:hypothetical protein
MRYLNRRELAAYCNERGLKITPAMFAKLAHFGGQSSCLDPRAG